MDGIKIDVIGNVAKVIKKPSRITSGTVGLPIEYTFDEQWDGLTKVAVFRGGAIEKSVDLVADLVIPWEVLLVPGVWLSVGVYGANEDGSVAIPTIWANVLPISVGVDPEGDPSIDPTLPIWADVLQRIADVYIELDKYDPTYGVRYIPQALVESQKAQARSNIDAVGSQYVDALRRYFEEGIKANSDNIKAINDNILEMKIDIDAFKGVENGLSGDTPYLTLRYDKASGQLTYGVSYTNDSNPETTAVEVWDNTHAGGLPENIPPILCDGKGEYDGMLVYSVKDPLQQDGMTRKLINFKINRNLNKSVLRFKIRYNTVALPDGTVVKPKLFVCDEWISPNVFGADYAVIDESGNPVGNPMLGLELYKWYTVYVTANGDADFQMWPVWNDIDELLIEAVIKDVELLHHETMPAYIRANSGTCGPMSLYKSPDGTWEYTYSSFKAEGSTNNTAYYRRLSMKLDSSDYVEARFDFMYTKSDYRGATSCNFASDVPVTVVDAQGNVVPVANRQLNTWYTAIFKKADGTNLPKNFDMYPQGYADGTSVGELNIEMQIKNCHAYRHLATVQTDTTLLKSGVAADAKATGDAIGQVRVDLARINTNMPWILDITTQCFYRTVDGEKEWMNPPMTVLYDGVSFNEDGSVVGEYRTSERYCGQPVYTCIIDTGAGVSGSSAEKTTNVRFESNPKVVRFSGFAVNPTTTEGRAIPYVERITSDARTYWAVNIARTDENNMVIVERSHLGRSKWNVYFQMWYTKALPTWAIATTVTE